MLEAVGDLWTYGGEDVIARVVTTNGVVRPDGDAVMGAGCALEAKERFPGIDTWLGKMIAKHGNHVFAARPNPAKDRPYWLITFPTKDDYRKPSDKELIYRSAWELRAVAQRDEGSTSLIILPRVGCGHGGLQWPDISKLIAPILHDERFVAITKNN